jgi:hypothetical protein
MWGIILVVWLIVEAVFYSWIQIFYRKSIEPVRNHSRFHLHTEKTLQHMKRMCTIIKRVSSLELFTNGFFCGASMSSLGKDNIMSFIAWAFTGQDFFHLRSSENTADKEKISMIEQCYTMLTEFFPSDMSGVKPGYNKNVRHVSMVLDPVVFIHRPWLFYALLWAFNWFYEAVCMRMLGGWHSSHINIASIHVNRKRGRGDFALKYWYRIPPQKQSEPAQEPMLFLHGISYGWIIYAYFLSMWQDRPLLMIDLDSIKIGTLSKSHPSAPALAQALKRILHKHGYSKADICGHSFGTMLATTVLNYEPDIIGDNLVLIDPVCLLLTLPDVAYNFLYKPSQTLFQFLIQLVASREATVARTLYRDFIWWEYDMILEKVRTLLYYCSSFFSCL